MEKVIERGLEIPGVVSLAIKPDTKAGMLKSLASCYDGGCFQGCIDSCDCFDSECNPSPDPAKKSY